MSDTNGFARYGGASRGAGGGVATKKPDPGPPSPPLAPLGLPFTHK